MITPSQHSIDWANLASVIFAPFIIPGWVIRKRQVEDPIPATNKTEAGLVIYRNLLQAGTSLFIRDPHGYIYLGQTRKILRLQPSRSLEAISLGRNLKGPEHEIRITHDRLGYQWEVEVSRLSPHA